MTTKEFFQDPPALENQYRADVVLRRFLSRVVPAGYLSDMEPALERVGAASAGPWYELSLRHRSDEPEFIPYDPWGRRIDSVRVSSAWDVFGQAACEEGLVALPYERPFGAHSRIFQFALAYLFSPSALTYACPLAMTDGAAKTLLLLATPELRGRILPHLISRDFGQAWISGQWMTERIGGSDVARTETTAVWGDGGWRLYGTKWFASAITSQVALTLARPEGNPPGGKGLALFFLHQRDEAGKSNGIRILRLKEKLGTRILPTAEIQLAGALAEPVRGLQDGVRNITTMLNTTRLWNAVDSVALMRRGLALAEAYAPRRIAFGGPLSEKPLFHQTLADLRAEFQACFLLAFHAAELTGKEEAGELDDKGRAVLRLLLPVAKLVTARRAVAHSSEILECFGGAGYLEDTGLPSLLRDSQVLSIWEGTTNVLSLDGLRAIERENALAAFLDHAREICAQAGEALLAGPEKTLLDWSRGLAEWHERHRGTILLEAGARRFAEGLGRVMQLALLITQGQADLTRFHEPATAMAAARLCRTGAPRLLEPADLESELEAAAREQSTASR